MTLVSEITWEDRVRGIMKTCGVERARAEVLARRSLGQPEPIIPPEQVAKDAAIAEDREQWEITKLFRAYGCKVYSTSQKRAAKVTPGIPDLWVTRKERGVAFWFECKRQSGGVYSSAQVDFREEATAGGVRCAGGDRFAAAQVLVEVGLAVPDGAGVCGISPIERGQV